MNENKDIKKKRFLVGTKELLFYSLNQTHHE